MSGVETIEAIIKNFTIIGNAKINYLNGAFYEGTLN